jgi:uncharacterized protein (UPF0335 family)
MEVEKHSAHVAFKQIRSDMRAQGFDEHSGHVAFKQIRSDLSSQGFDLLLISKIKSE